MTQQLKRNENLHPHKTGTQMSLALVGQNWRQPKCPLTGKLRWDVVHPYSGYSPNLIKA